MNPNSKAVSCEMVGKIREKLEKVSWMRTQDQFTRSVYTSLQKHCKEVSTTFEDEDIYVSCRTYNDTVLTFVITIKLRPRFTKKLGKIHEVLRDFDGYEIVNADDVKNLNETINTILRSMELPYRVHFKIYEDAEDLGIVVARLQDIPIGGYFVFRNIMFTGELSIYDLNKDTVRVVTVPVEFAPHAVAFIGAELPNDTVIEDVSCSDNSDRKV
jgi:hypothetical protein